MKFGIAREIITPKIGCQLYGYRPDIFSESVNDDLVATIFYFTDGNKEAFLISATLCVFQTKLSNEIREILSNETGVPCENIILCATHTHTGPNTSGDEGWGDVDKEYCDTILIPRLIKASKNAKSSAVDAEMGIAYTNSEAGINRRQLDEDGTVLFGQNPWGIYDPKMTVIAFRNLSGKPMANIIHYGMHSTCAGPSTAISRDWAGVACDTLERETGAITAFIAGPEGDVGPRLSDGRTDSALHFIYEIGYIAGADILKAYKDIKLYQKDISLKIEEISFPLSLKKRISPDFAKKLYEKFGDDAINIEGLMKSHAKNVIKSYEEGYKDESSHPSVHSFLILGDIAIVSTSYELFSEIGLRIAEHSPFPYTLTLACTNGSEGYFPSQSELCHGGYEVDYFLYKRIQPFIDNVDQQLMKNIVSKLKELYI